MQQNKGSRAKSPHQHDFVRHEREKGLGEGAEGQKVRPYTSNEHEIINPLLAVPLHSSIFNAHDYSFIL
jgi:hypothetical protein